jgi:hypothetical protein
VVCSCESFGFLIAIIYIKNAVVDLVKFFNEDPLDAALLQLVICFGSFWLCLQLSKCATPTCFVIHIVL